MEPLFTWERGMEPLFTWERGGGGGVDNTQILENVRTDLANWLEMLSFWEGF